MGFYQFKKTQEINASLEEVWKFISDPANLKKITPDYMGFDIISKDVPSEMYAGMIISYKVSPLFGIKTTWVTEITHLKENSYFVDEQRVGPYKIWHHQHMIQPMEKGTLMTDIVSYQPPLGLLGSVANTLIIKGKLNEIFDYRTKALDEIF
ncbi:ligand-binding SRPBCC domain-containing protein [Arenibacter algicola]|uniref:Cell division inhibitor n=1 Tax=Arenibacter algicola TaxID=616991 RepID=A0A221USC8_9FLAO|nr:SRPBCC family protein [Arenibacter algicola]ASO04160.1 cell division inhibitor [Arenibacter algicola]MDX1759515.1 SRPBCC family protein [Arenibacter algicola]|tara:strand:- start:138 stop:593 length:456 start_codon:yes stop_codon:yes gene_type:complete